MSAGTCGIDRIVRQGLRCLALAAAGIILASFPGTGPAFAQNDSEVECNSIRLQISGDGYDVICTADRATNVTYETLEANSADGSHFLLVTDARTNHQFIFDSMGLRESLSKIYDDLDLSGWKGGKSIQGLTTAEFDSDIKTVPSACVGFQKYTSRDQWGGWRRHIFGFGCSRTGDRNKVYEALERIKFP